MEQFGERLRTAREFLGLTQSQVASTLNMTRNMIVNIENNNRTVKSDELYKFSKLYGVSMEELVSDDNTANDDIQLFARGFENLSDKDKQEIISLIKFKNDFKE